MPERITINRAPVLTLWAAVVAERLGHDRAAALTLGKCVAGLNAQSKGRMLGIYGPAKGPEGGGGPPKRTGLGEDSWVELCDRGVPCQHTAAGLRAVVKDKPIDPGAVERYLGGKFGDDLDRVRSAMDRLARAFDAEELAARAYGLYEQFRPQIPPGRRGWGARGTLDLDFIRSLAPAR